jgi:hypothetical protein
LSAWSAIPTRARSSRARGRLSRAASTSQKSIGSITFSATVSVGSSWKNWNTTPTVRPRQGDSARSGISCTLAPATTTSPPLGRSIPAIRFSRVDLPLPDRPVTAASSPAASSRSTSRSAGQVPAGVA